MLLTAARFLRERTAPAKVLLWDEQLASNCPALHTSLVCHPVRLDPQLLPVRAAGRLMRCLFEVCMRRGWAGLTDKALMLSKCVVRRMWGSQTPLRQFKGIPGEILTKVGWW